MKTISQGAQEYASKDFSNKSSFEFHNQYTSFQAGAEFVQRWIPVEEELPEESQDGQSDIVLFITKDEELSYRKGQNEFAYMIGIYDFECECWQDLDDLVIHSVTHWRPINYEL